MISSTQMAPRKMYRSCSLLQRIKSQKVLFSVGDGAIVEFVEAANVACSGGVPDQGSTDTGSSDYYHYCHPWKGHSGTLHRCKQTY